VGYPPGCEQARFQGRNELELRAPVFNLSVFNHSVFNLSVFNLSVFNLSVFNLSVFNLSVFNPLLNPAPGVSVQ